MGMVMKKRSMGMEERNMVMVFKNMDMDMVMVEKSMDMVMAMGEGIMIMTMEHWNLSGSVC